MKINSSNPSPVVLQANPSFFSSKKKLIIAVLIILAMAFLIARLVLVIKNYQQPTTDQIDFSFYSSANIPDFLDGYVERIGGNFITVKNSQSKIINLDLSLPTEVKIVSTTTPFQATPSAKSLGSLTEPSFVSKPVPAKLTDIKSGDTVSVLFTKGDDNKVAKQEITIIK